MAEFSTLIRDAVQARRITGIRNRSRHCCGDDKGLHTVGRLEFAVDGAHGYLDGCLVQTDLTCDAFVGHPFTRKFEDQPLELNQGLAARPVAGASINEECKKV